MVVFSTTAAVCARGGADVAVGVTSDEEKIAALENSFVLATLYECEVDSETGAIGETASGRLLGCARATSDHVFNAAVGHRKWARYQGEVGQGARARDDSSDFESRRGQCDALRGSGRRAVLSRSGSCRIRRIKGMFRCSAD